MQNEGDVIDAVFGEDGKPLKFPRQRHFISTQRAVA